MSEIDFDAHMEQLLKKVRQLPLEKQQALQSLIEETRDRQYNNKKNLQLASEALGSWRLWLKYLVFSLEAQARERNQGN